jgi:hypothetical protein
MSDAVACTLPSPLPEGWHPDPKAPADPIAEPRAAAKFVGYARGTIYRLQRQGRLNPTPIPSRSTRGRYVGLYITGYRLSALAPLRAEAEAARRQDAGRGKYQAADGPRLDAKRAAPLVGVCYQTLRRELERPDLLKGLFEELGIAPMWMPWARGGKGSFTIPEEDARRLRWALERELRKKPTKGYAGAGEIAGRLGVNDILGLRELARCLRRWYDAGRLPGVPMLRRRAAKVTTPRGVLPTTPLRAQVAYHIARAVELWERECSPKAGARLLRDLLVAGPKPAAEVKEAMAARGFVESRFYEAVRAAGAVRRRAGPARAAGWVYDLPRGEARRPAREVLEGILAAGPVRAKEVARKLREAGWTRWSAEVLRAKRKMGVRCARAADTGDCRRPWYWCLPGHQPPANGATTPAATDHTAPRGAAARPRRRGGRKPGAKGKKASVHRKRVIELRRTGRYKGPSDLTRALREEGIILSRTRVIQILAEAGCQF